MNCVGTFNETLYKHYTWQKHNMWMQFWISWIQFCRVSLGTQKWPAQGPQTRNINKTKRDLDEERKSKENIDNALKQMRKQKNDVSNQLVSATLRKDALEDETVHLKEELRQLKDQVDLVQVNFAATAQMKEQLAERLLQSERELKEQKIL